MDTGIFNLTESATEVAKNSTVSFNLEGWPAAVAFMSIPASIFACYAIKTCAAR